MSTLRAGFFSFSAIVSWYRLTWEGLPGSGTSLYSTGLREKSARGGGGGVCACVCVWCVGGLGAAGEGDDARRTEDERCWRERIQGRVSRGGEGGGVGGGGGEGAGDRGGQCMQRL
jgi:hypothetical protein